MIDHCDPCNDTGRQPCPLCGGDGDIQPYPYDEFGDDAFVTCPDCDGEGLVLTRRHGFDWADPCPDCNGTGKVRCRACRCDCGDNWTDGKDHRDCWEIP